MATFPAVFRLLTPGTTSAPQLINPDGTPVVPPELGETTYEDFIFSQPQSGPQQLVGYNAVDDISTPYQAAFAAGTSPGAFVTATDPPEPTPAVELPNLVTELNASTFANLGTASFSVMDLATNGNEVNLGTQSVVAKQPSVSGGDFVFDGTSSESITIAQPGVDLNFENAGGYIFDFFPDVPVPLADQIIFSHWGSGIERTTVRINTVGQIEWAIAISPIAFAIAVLPAAAIDMSQRNTMTCQFIGSAFGAGTNAERAIIRINSVQQALSFSGTVPATMAVDNGSPPPSWGSFNNIANFCSMRARLMRVFNGVPTEANLQQMEQG